MGFKGGFSAFTDAFMRSMEVGNERKRLDAERAEQKARQEENDKWTREQRDAERKNRAEADDVRQKLASAAGPVTEEVAQHGPSIDGQPLPGIKQTRSRTLGEQLDATADVYASKGNLPEALKYRELSAADQARRSIQAFSNLQASSKGVSPDQLIDQAIQIFNNDPTLAHIENKRTNPDGTYTMDIYNKKTGQRVTQTFKPEEIMTGLRMHYDQAGALLQQSEEAKRSRELKGFKPGDTILDGNGRLVRTIPDRLKVGGIGGAGGGGNATQGGVNGIAPASKLDIGKRYEKILSDLIEKSKDSGETIEQLQPQAMKLAMQEEAQWADLQKASTQNRAIAQILGPLHSGRQANAEEYAGVYQRMLQKGVTAEHLQSIGFPPPQGWTGRR